MSRQWAPYLCTTVGKCHEIDDVQIFIDNSLTQKLKPKPNCKRVKDNNTKGKNAVLHQSKSESGAKDKTTDSKPTEQSTTQDSDSNNSASKFKTESDIRRAKRLINLSRSQCRKGQIQEDEEGEVLEDGERRVREEGDGDETDVTKTETESTATTGADSTQTDVQGPPVEAVPQEPPKPPIKLSYTSSNITLKGLYDNPILGSVIKSETKEPRALGVNLDGSSMLKNQVRLFTPPSKPATPKTNPNPDNENRISSGTVKTDEPTSADGSGLTISSFRSSSYVTVNGITDDAESSRPPSQRGPSAQRQVMLVLKKVSLQENLQEGEDPDQIKWLPPSASRPTSQQQRLRQNSLSLSLKNGNLPNGKTGVPLLWMNPDELEKSPDLQTLDEHTNGKMSTKYFQIGDLLPAVDNSMKRKLPVRTMNGERTGSATDKEISVNGKDVLVPFEDNLIMMKEGVELLRLKEKNSTVSEFFALEFM